MCWDRIDGWIDSRRYGRIDGWIDDGRYGRIDGWIDNGRDEDSGLGYKAVARGQAYHRSLVLPKSYFRSENSRLANARNLYV